VWATDFQWWGRAKDSTLPGAFIKKRLDNLFSAGGLFRLSFSLIVWKRILERSALECGGFDAAFPVFQFELRRNEMMGKRRRTRRTPKAPPNFRLPGSP